MICLRLSSVPPSSNHAYFNLPRGGRSLSTEGKRYKAETTAQLVRNYPKEMQFFRPNTPYLILVRIHFETILNAGYPKKAESRYKKLDVSNRLKLLEDCLKDAGGIDDSQYLQLVLEKCQGPVEGTTIWAWDLEKEKNPISEFLSTLV